MSVWLDCSNPGTAAASLGQALGIKGSSVEAAARQLEVGRISDGGDVRIALPRAVLDSLGSSLPEAVEAIQGVYYFHGTRFGHPERVLEEGLLPLNLVVSRVMDELDELARLICPTAGHPSEALADGRGGDFGCQARLKLNDPIHYGPWGELVRENVASTRLHGFHDYCEWPEIVEDVVGAFRYETGCDLTRAYKAGTFPYVVKFRVSEVCTSAIEAALWHIYEGGNRVEPTSNTRWAFDGKGKCVNVSDIESIERIDITT